MDETQSNATWFRGFEGRVGLFTAFKRYIGAEKASGSSEYWSKPENVLGWAQTSPMYSLQFADGQVVRYTGNGLVGKTGHYGIVDRHVTACYRDLMVKFADGTYKVDWREIEDAEIPAEIVAIASDAKCGADVGPLKAKCPFKDGWKEPVPPCMKTEEEKQ